MNIIQTNIPSVLIIKPRVFKAPAAISSRVSLRESLMNRRAKQEQSQAVLKEIDIQYRKEGGDPYEQYKMYRFRNRILYSRLSEKLKVLKNKHKL